MAHLLLTAGIVALCLTASPAGADGASERPSFRELGYRLHPPAQWLAHGIAAGALVPIEDGKLLHLTSDDGGTVRVSEDDGETWKPVATMYDGEGPGKPTRDLECGTAVQTPSGAIVYIYRDFENWNWTWDNDQGRATEARLDVWSIRSLDGGKTWQDRRQILDGYCGAIQDIIVTDSGAVVVPVEFYIDNPGRHATRTWRSTDDGATWEPSNIVDLGGHGHHDGAMEATLAETSDGRVQMLIRTSLDRFWRAWSFDDGRTWRQLEPTEIGASNAPGYLIRLDSGRMALVWNPLSPGYEMRPIEQLAHEDPPHSQGTEVRCNGWRDTLVMALSEDDGETWSEPRIIAEGPRVCYPQILERRPGELWISFVAGSDWEKNLVRVNEEDLLGPPAEAGEPLLTIVSFGDSTTAPRSRVATYSNQIDWTLADEGTPVEIINAGVGGNNTAMARERFEDDVLAHEPDLAVIQFGICDSAVNVWEGATEPRVSIEDFEANLRHFVETLRAQGADVILMTPNPLRWTEKLLKLYGKPPYDPEDPEGFNLLLTDYAQRVREVAEDTDATLIDSFAAFERYGAEEGRSVDDLLLDGMHPNSLGHTLEAEMLLEEIRPMAAERK